MADAHNSDKQPPENKPRKDWILWSVVWTFVILAIAGMWAIDYFYAPEMLSPATVPDAVGK